MLLNSGPCITSRVSTDSGVSDSLAAYAISLPPTAKMRETVSWAQELPGGNGILVDYNVARFFADTEALYSYQGTYQMQHLIVGKAVTGFSAFH
jgi:glutaryl-CoA dehydrogenase